MIKPPPSLERLRAALDYDPKTGVFTWRRCVNTPAATEIITIYDNTAASGTKIGTITVYASTNPCLTYDVNFTAGLTLVTATASSDLTVSYY